MLKFKTCSQNNNASYSMRYSINDVVLIPNNTDASAYVYIYIERERQTDRQRKRDRERVNECIWLLNTEMVKTFN